MQRNKSLYTTMDAYNWMMDIAQGMQYLHSSNPIVIHRDLKPENVMFRQTQGRPKAVIVDFGLHTIVNQNRCSDNQHTFALTGNVGSYLYMAPEVFLNQTYNEKVDVFSFGVIVWELFSKDMLSSRVAINGTRDEVIRYCAKVSVGYREPLPERWPKLLRELIKDCQQTDLEKRPTFSEIVGRVRDMEESIEDWDEKLRTSSRCCVCL
eukprot:TRINITY_DN8583_c0_g1_i2.p3 TRINITY_DN8583_c0_g1~~TRINITY_DN8583_c0_g1_i2.p3  ORF type:complete len:208 (-),score=8.16 TRINITY_DN8583_c0_g1_i2:1538-2161(-)